MYIFGRSLQYLAVRFSNLTLSFLKKNIFVIEKTKCQKKIKEYFFICYSLCIDDLFIRIITG